jgi:hypothetical protein
MVLLATLFGFRPESSSAAPVADVTGDGKADIVSFGVAGGSEQKFTLSISPAPSAQLRRVGALSLSPGLVAVHQSWRCAKTQVVVQSLT